MTSYKNAPIRKWKMDELTKKLKGIEEHEGRKLTQVEKIYHIFAHTFKHYDTEEEEETKGVSARELILILNISYDNYPYGYGRSNKITTQDITMSENGYDWAGKRVYKAVQNLKSTIQRFKDWQEDGFSGQYQDNDTAFNIYCLKTKKGNWYYYNVMNDKDLEKMKLHKAKMALGYQKHIRKLDEELDKIELNPEEYKKKKEKEAAELKKQQKRRVINTYKRLMEMEGKLGRKSRHDYVEEIKKRLSYITTKEEDNEVELELEQYAAEIEIKQMKADLKEQQKKEKELWDKKPHVDVSLNKKMEEYVIEEKEGNKK